MAEAIENLNGTADDLKNLLFLQEFP